MVVDTKRFSVDSGCDISMISIKTPSTPFLLQAGGHVTLSVNSDGHLEKPCNVRESLFYETIPDQLRQFTPICHAILQPSELSFDWSPPSSYNSSPCPYLEEIEERREVPQQINLSKGSHTLVLEDLTRGFSIPCVMDLKLGTRQHGDSASPEKIRRQKEKCRATTSHSMGIRFCGMKRGSMSGGVEFNQDKYEGREMDSEGLRETIRRFFEGRGRATERVERAAREIREVLLELPGLRLYGSSLLIVIEADQLVTAPKCQVRLVDFANVAWAPVDGEWLHKGPDRGAIKGLESLIGILEKLQ